MDCCDHILGCGFNKPLAQLKMGDIPHLLRSATLHSTILCVKFEIDQFMEGFHEAGVLHAIKEYPHLFRSKSDAATLDAGCNNKCLMKNVFMRQIHFCIDFILDLFKKKVFSEP